MSEIKQLSTMEVECTECGHYEDVPQNLNTCESCKFIYAGKTDDGRFYRCENELYKSVTGNESVNPNFGCVFFEKEVGNG